MPDFQRCLHILKKKWRNLQAHYKQDIDTKCTYFANLEENHTVFSYCMKWESTDGSFSRKFVEKNMKKLRIYSSHGDL